MAEKRVIELEIQDNSRSLKAQYREAVQELQRVSAQYGETSQQAVKAAKAAADLKDQIGFSKDLVDSFNPDAKFNALSRSVGGVLDGFQAFEGALGLIGVESENLQKTMVRLQSVMALSQGLQGLMEAKDSFKQLGTVAVNALKGVRGALIATGIGALVVALGTIVAYWDDIKAAVSGVTAEQEDLNKKTEQNVELENEKLTALNGQDNILKLQGLSERQILQLKIKQIELVIAATEEQIKQNEITQKAQEEATLRNFEIAKKVIAAITKIALIPVTAMIAQIDLLIKGANYVSEALGGGKLIDLEPLKEANKFFDSMAEKGAKFLFDPDQVKADGEKLKKETEKQLTELKNTRAGYQLAIKDIDMRAAEQAKQNREKALSEEEKRQKEHQEKYLNEDRLRTQSVLEASNARILQAQKETEEQRIQNEIRVQSNKEYLDKIAAQERAAFELKAALQQQGLQVALQGVELIANIFENQKGVQKAALLAESAIGIAKMIISNKLANAGALATPQAIATSGAAAAPVIALNNISTGIGIAANIAATAKALKQLGGGAPPQAPPLSGGGGGAGGVQSPNFSVIGSSGVNQLAQLQQQPTRAYVVSGEVTSQQALDRNRVQNATL